MYKTSFIALFIFFSVIYGISNAQSGLTNRELHKINSVSTAVPFLTIAPDSRSAAMGDVGVATTPDINSLHWNPAKYAFVKIDQSIALSYSPWLRGLVNDMNLLYFTGYKRLDDFQVVAASLRYFNMGSINFYGEHGNYIDSRRPNEFSLDVAYSRKFAEKVSAALAFRYIRSDISAGITNSAMQAKAGNSFAADIAMYYSTDLDIFDKGGNWAFGTNVSNIGSKMSYSNEQHKMFIPINMRVGTSLGLNLDTHNKMTFAVDFNKLLVPTPPEYDPVTREIIKGKERDVGVVQGIFQSFSDAPGGFSEEMREISYGMGLEYFYREVFAIRTGFFYENPSKGNRRYFTLGVGLNMSMIDIDFSYLISTYGQSNPLNNTLRFTLTFNFGKDFRTS